MPNPSILPRDMVLYSPAEPDGRMFIKGDQWPGDAWSEKPGGEPAGAKTAAAATADLGALRTQYEALQAQTDRLTHDLAQAAKDRDEAVAMLAEYEQAKNVAEKERDDAQEAARTLTEERDRLAANETTLNAKVAASAETEAARVADLVQALDAANKLAADRGDEIEALKGKIAKVDADGDGNPGGSKKKTASDDKSA